MPVNSRWNIPVPTCSLPTWVFGPSSDPPSSDSTATKQFIDADRPDTHYLSQADFRLYSQRMALGLQRAGLREGDRVLLYSGNNLFFPVVFMGIVMAGGVFSGANPSFVARELAYQLKDSGASFLIAAKQALPVAVEAASQAGLSQERVYAFDDSALDLDRAQQARGGPKPPSHVPQGTTAANQAGTHHWTDLLAPLSEARGFQWFEPRDSTQATCALNYSSGTTGVPKGVEITHYSYVANGESVRHVVQLQDDYESWRRRQAQLCFLPLYHALGQTYFVSNFPRFRIPVYMMSGPFDFEKLLRNVERYRITILTTVPPIVVALAKHPASKKYDLSSVEGIGCGAAPLGLEISEEVSQLWPKDHLSLSQGWGMTEVTCSAMGHDPRDPKELSTSVGEMMPNTAARLVDPATGAEITSANTRGELWVATPTLMKGYWRKPEATASTIEVDPKTGTRWLKTGDVAYVTEYAPGGKWYIVDRIKELIKVKGNQVAPAELEGLLLEHPGVVDAAVVGVTIKNDEYPRAYIVPNPAKKPTEEEIAKWMESKVVRYKWLRGGVKFIPEIPKNPVSNFLFFSSPFLPPSFFHARISLLRDAGDTCMQRKITNP